MPPQKMDDARRQRPILPLFYSLLSVKLTAGELVDGEILIDFGGAETTILIFEVDEGKKADTPAGQTTSGEDKRVLRLQEEVDDLQKQVRQKDMEIADLKSQLAAQQQSVQTQPSSMPVDYSYSPPPSTSVSSAFVLG